VQDVGKKEDKYLQEEDIEDLVGFEEYDADLLETPEFDNWSVQKKCEFLAKGDERILNWALFFTKLASTLGSPAGIGTTSEYCTKRLDCLRQFWSNRNLFEDTDLRGHITFSVFRRMEKLNDEQWMRAAHTLTHWFRDPQQSKNMHCALLCFYVEYIKHCTNISVIKKNTAWGRFKLVDQNALEDVGDGWDGRLGSSHEYWCLHQVLKHDFGYQSFRQLLPKLGVLDSEGVPTTEACIAVFEGFSDLSQEIRHNLIIRLPAMEGGPSSWDTSPKGIRMIFNLLQSTEIDEIREFLQLPKRV
jgi:hypothetical protein